MKKILIVASLAFFMTASLQAESLEDKIAQQNLEIIKLKRELSVKDQEIKILLITLKNTKQEGTVGLNKKGFDFKNVRQTGYAKVIVKPSMFNEQSIKAITPERFMGGIVNDDTNTTAMGVVGDDVVIEKKDKVEKVIPKLTFIKPSKFELTVDSKVCEKIYGKTKSTWKKGQRFTSNKMRGEWIKITGKITKSGWKMVNSDLWISSKNTKKVK